MKHSHFSPLITCVLILLITASSAAFCAMKLYRDSVIRERPSFFAAALGTAKRGSGVNAIDKEGAWYKVRVGKAVGWLPENAFQAPVGLPSGLAAASGGAGGTAEAKPATGAAAVKATAGSASLAGKGFDLEAEKESRRTASKNYAAVDLMQSYSIPRTDRAAFLSAGRSGGGK